MKKLQRYLLILMSWALIACMLVACGANAKMEASFDRMDAPQTSGNGKDSYGIYNTADSLYAEKTDNVPSVE